MKIELPSLNILIKAFVMAGVFAVAGYFLYPFLQLDNLASNRMFSYAILIGVLCGAIFAHVRITSSKSAQIESLFVGNLAFKAPPRALREEFEKYGNVHALRLMTDRVTHKPRGFGFVEMPHKEAMAAIRGLNGKEFYGRQLKVNIAKERTSREEMADD